MLNCKGNIEDNTDTSVTLNKALNNFQVMNSHPEFRAMMQSMQSVSRSGKVKQIGDLSVGDFVIARFKDDKVLYRALVEEAGFGEHNTLLRYCLVLSNEGLHKEILNKDQYST